MAGDSQCAGVVVVDRHPLYRSALEQEIARQPRLRVLGGFATATEALAGVAQLDPDVAVVDVRLPDSRGLSLVRTLTTEHPATRTVVLTAEDDGSLVYEALAIGVNAFLSKDADGDAICDAIAAAAAGDTRVSPDLQRAMAAEIRLHASARAVALTPRERDVLALVAKGCSAPEIGRHLFVSRTTVRSHLRNVYEKLGVSDRAEAVAEGFRRGLLDTA
jgi:two-component system, NarL family, nitrate/nitrite response regulator NarL